MCIDVQTRRGNWNLHAHFYLGSADIKTQNFSSDLQRLRVEDLSYHPETCLESKIGIITRLKCERQDQKHVQQLQLKTRSAREQPVDNK